MSTIDTSTWNPDADLNVEIEGIPLNANASIMQTWQVIRILMAAFKGDTSAIQALMVPFSGATTSTDGKQGLVPAPEAGDEDKVLKGDGTWGALSASDIPNIDASKITSGTIDLARLPAGALERLVTVADQTARFALTTASVQLGDTVKQLDTGVMYIVVDTAKLNQAAGYVEFTAGSATSVPWSGITDKPSTFTPSSHTHGSITNDGKLGTASRVVVTDGSKAIGVSSIATTKLGYLTDVTANIQGQIDGKADKATTLAGYGITDAKIASGVITLGSDTITPLTSSSSLDASNLTGTASVNTTGNAATATKLATPVTINGVSFDGSANITVADSTKVAKAGGTMTGDLTISSTSPNLFLQNTLVERGTAPSSYKATTEILGKDKSDKNAWALEHTYGTDKTHRINLLCYNGLTTDNAYASITVGYDSRGNPFTSAPTPSSTTDSTTKIATTRWVRTATGNFACNAATATQASSLQYKPTGINLDTPPTSLTEKYCLSIVKSDAQTVNTGNYLRLGVSQSANDKDYRITFGVSNPRASNLPSAESIAGGNDDSDAFTSNCWGCIGVYYDYSKNRAFPYCNGLSTCDLTDNGTNRLATNYWVRNATGNFACNAATASAFASSKDVALTGAVTGTASSTGGWTVSTVWRSCIVGRTDSGTSNPWYKVASRTLTGGSTNYQITFYVENCNTVDKFSGILRINVSTNSSKIVDSSSNIYFTWIVNDGFNVEDFVFVCPTTAQPTVEIWAKFARGYLRRRFTVISEGYTSSTSVGWTLYNSVSAGQEASITTQGTQIVSTNKTITNAQIDALFS